MHAQFFRRPHVPAAINYWYCYELVIGCVILATKVRLPILPEEDGHDRTVGGIPA